MEPIRTRKEPLLLAGMSARLPRGKNQQRVKIIQTLTKSFLQRVGEITNRVGGERYSVIENDAWDNGSEPIIRTMVAVDSFQMLPDWSETLTIGSGSFAVFRHQGLPRDISNTVEEVHKNWAHRIPGLFKQNLELYIYQSGYDPTNPEGSFEYWLPLSRI